eukprot:1045854-Rhodomonas_salina.2
MHAPEQANGAPKTPPRSTVSGELEGGDPDGRDFERAADAIVERLRTATESLQSSAMRGAPEKSFLQSPASSKSILWDLNGSPPKLSPPRAPQFGSPEVSHSRAWGLAGGTQLSSAMQGGVNTLGWEGGRREGGDESGKTFLLLRMQEEELNALRETVHVLKTDKQHSTRMVDVPPVVLRDVRF